MDAAKSRSYRAGLLILAGLIGTSAAAAADKDLYGDPLPEGAVARLGSGRFRDREGQIRSLHFSADGKTLVTLGGEGDLRFWETKTGQLRREVRLDPIYVRAAAFSSDGRQIALQGSKRMAGEPPRFEEVRRLVATDSGKEVRRLAQAAREGAHDLAFTPDGKFLLTLGGGVLHIEEIASGMELLQQKIPVTLAAPSPSRRTAKPWPSGPVPTARSSSSGTGRAARSRAPSKRRRAGFTI